MENGVHERLREQTWAIHQEIETLPYAGALREGSLPLEAYVGHLRCLAVVHAALERSLRSAGGVALHVWRQEESRLPLLMADLEFFRPRFVRDVLPAVGRALEMAGDIRRRCGSAPASLLGFLYVLEGSAKGGLTLAPMVKESLDLADGRGVSYLESGGLSIPARFNAFMDRMDEALGDGPGVPEVIEGARRCFASLRDVFAALYPVGAENLGFHVVGLNPEAGEHAVPAGEDEIAAAVRAGERCLAEYPYFERRYGERGRRFTASDSAWLVTLSRLGREEALAQALWLGNVLASRGMPRILLGMHLEHLAGELESARPAQADRYAVLRGVAGELRGLFDAVIPREDQASLREWFWSTVDEDGLRSGLPEAPELVLAAVADEANGVEGAVESLNGWLAGAGKHSGKWRQAVLELTGRARSLAHGRGRGGGE